MDEFEMKIARCEARWLQPPDDEPDPLDANDIRDQRRHDRYEEESYER